MKTIHITANSRLSVSIKQQAILDAGQQVIETPVVMTLAQWWQEWQSRALLTAELTADDLPNKILNGFEAQWLWEQVLEQELERRQQQSDDDHDDRSDDGLENGPNGNSNGGSNGSIALLNIATTAKQLYQAWSLSLEWLPENWAQEHFMSAETALFQNCLQAYLAKLNRKNWQDETLFSQARLAWLAEKKIGQSSLPQQFVLHGFDDLSPNIQAWLNAVQQLGCQVVNQTQPLKTGSQFKLAYQTLSCYGALDSFDEVQQVALWAIKKVADLQKDKPIEQVKVAVVAPNLADYKTALTQALDEQLVQFGLGHLQSSEQGGSNQAQKLYNFSLGEPLAQIPIIENAWQTLSLVLQPQKSLPYQEWSEWLTSAYTLGDYAQRHQADAQFRRLQWANIQWPNLLETEASKSLPKVLVKALESVKETNAKERNSKEKSTASSYVSLEMFIDQAWSVLESLNWPGLRTLSSSEFQQKTAFENALNQFSALTDLAGKQSYGKWLSLLKRFLGELVHQPQSVGVQPIQIIGMLEAGGQDFDALWIVGLSNEAWPRISSPNPFLPNHLQRQYGLPRSDAVRELIYAQQLSQRLVESAQQVVWSYPLQAGEAKLLPSQLFPTVDETSEEEGGDTVTAYEALTYQSLATALFSHRPKDALFWQEDFQGAEIEVASIAPGGTGILQAQSQCPLMAYVDYRLGAKYGLQTVEDSLQNTNQGTLIHSVLEHFWQETQTQIALLGLSEEEKTERLKKHIQQAFEELQSGLAEGVVAVEQQRILELCLQWLETESQRQSFAVAETEAEHFITLAGIEFKVIIDRVDKVDGKAVILDYKTGKASINGLLQTPLAAPQLAVYLHALEGDVSGIGYALLHSDDGVKISAVVEEEEVLLKSRSISVFAKMAEKEGCDYYEIHWTDFLDHLKQQVFDLAQEIQQGKAPMIFNKPADIQYAEGYLALRVPEVLQQRQDAALIFEELE